MSGSSWTGAELLKPSPLRFHQRRRQWSRVFLVQLSGLPAAVVPFPQHQKYTKGNERWMRACSEGGIAPLISTNFFHLCCKLIPTHFNQPLWRLGQEKGLADSTCNYVGLFFFIQIKKQSKCQGNQTVWDQSLRRVQKLFLDFSPHPGGRWHP